MTAERYQRVVELFHAALELEPEARSAFLAQACAGDEELRREVEAMLAADAKSDGFLDRPADDLAASAMRPGDHRSLIGRRFLSYEVVSRLGAGGMGEVYLARDSKLKREVAIKVLPAALASDPDRMSRFQREAQVLAALNHPNIAAIYGLEEWNGLSALVMELVEGPTLAERIAGRALPLEQALPIAKQIAEALEAAHERGIVHRDLKPANIKLTIDGKVKVLDFGLAKRQEPAMGSPEDSPTLTSTEEGVILGTAAYMSPEQALGKQVDQRADIWAFGVVLYEMLTGNRLFQGETTTEILAAVLTEDPDFEGVPARARSLLHGCLEKDPANRRESAHKVTEELKVLGDSLAPASAVKLSRNAWIAVGLAVVLAGLIASWLWLRLSRERWVLRTAIPEIGRLMDLGEYVKAAALTREARAVLPNDPTLEALFRRATGEISLASVPSGAEVSIRQLQGDPNAWEILGKTPIKKLRVPRDVYVWRLAKPGFAPIVFIHDVPGPDPPGTHYGVDFEINLRRGSVPPDMVVVPASWPIGLGYPLNEAPQVQVDEFLIDRHEVTNEEYQKFVEAGGYQKREYWKQPFVKNGRTVPWEEAMILFHDATGRPGPSTWEVGDYPRGHEKYPVAGVSWYEAAAYAEFVGKSLPTAYHWTWASQWATQSDMYWITSGSNFGREGTHTVGNARALSGFGTTDMAGNVKEWCLNETREGKRIILGGGFGEPTYMFYTSDAQSPWDRRANFGFRCVRLNSPPTAAAAARIEVPTRDYLKEKRISEEAFQAYSSLYVYDKGKPNARVEETVKLEGASREKVTLDAAYGHERVIAYLFLPKNASPPFQTVVYFPGAFALSDDKLDLASAEDSYDFLLRSGRALVFPIYKGMFERRDGFAEFGSPPAFERDHVIAWSKDLGRTLDYLETRKDIDSTKLAYFGLSLGAVRGPLLLAIEKRIKTAILASGGIYRNARSLPEVDPLNFASHVTIPVLMLNGRYDDGFPLESSQRPLFRVLGTPANDKKHVLYEGGHGAFPRPEAVRECLDWLDKYLGSVRH